MWICLPRRVREAPGRPLWRVLQLDRKRIAEGRAAGGGGGGCGKLLRRDPVAAPWALPGSLRRSGFVPLGHRRGSGVDFSAVQETAFCDVARSTGARGEVPRSSELFERFRMVVAGALPSAAVLLCGRVFRYLPLLGGVAPRGRDGRAGSAGIVVAVVRRSESRLRSARATARASLRAAEELESLFMRIAVFSSAAVLLAYQLYHAPEHGVDSAPRSGRSVIHRGTVC